MVATRTLLSQSHGGLRSSDASAAEGWSEEDVMDRTPHSPGPRERLYARTERVGLSAAAVDGLEDLLEPLLFGRHVTSPSELMEEASKEPHAVNGTGALLLCTASSSSRPSGICLSAAI